MITAFLRNDDIRDSLDDTLEYLTFRAVEAGIPVTHAVEPANTKDHVVEWLIEQQAKFPKYIGIIQHGYEHKIKTHPPVRGEFGGGRPFRAQLDDIVRGAALMDRFFGKQWTRIFSFPYGTYDSSTLRALETCKFVAITTGIRLTKKRKLFNTIGRLLRSKHWMGQNIVYFNEKIPGSRLYELPVVANNTKRQTGPDTGIQKTTDELRTEWSKIRPTVKTRGILCHHRFNSRSDIDQLIGFMQQLKVEGVTFAKIEDLYEKVGNL